MNVSCEFDIEAIDAGPDTGEDRHGVNFLNLAATVQAVKETPVLAYVGDEPFALLGSDAGPSPSETLLHAMANCVSVTIAMTS